MPSDKQTGAIQRFIKKAMALMLVFVMMIELLSPNRTGKEPPQFDAERTPTMLTHCFACGWQAGHATGCLYYQGMEHHPEAVAYVFGDDA